jgi:hypothetical protein
MLSFSSRRDVCTSTIQCISMVLCEEKVLYYNWSAGGKSGETHLFEQLNLNMLLLMFPHWHAEKITVTTALLYCWCALTTLPHFSQVPKCRKICSLLKQYDYYGVQGRQSSVQLSSAHHRSSLIGISAPSSLPRPSFKFFSTSHVPSFHRSSSIRAKNLRVASPYDGSTPPFPCECCTPRRDRQNRRTSPHTFKFTHCSVVYVRLPDSKITNGTTNAVIICNSSLPLSGNRKQATKRVTGVHRQKKMHLGGISKEDKVPNGDGSLLVGHIELLRFSCHEEAATEDGLLVLVSRLGCDGSLSII